MWPLRFLTLVQLSHYIHINTAKVNILKSCPRLCPLSRYEDKGFFFFLPSSQATITALIYLPGIKCWWVPVSSGWHLFHQRSQSRGRGTLTVGMEKKESCLHTQPTDVVELLSSLGCPLVSLRDAWWQRWGSKSCGRLRVGGSVPLRVPCHGRARPGPCATVSSASAVSMPYAPGHFGEGTWGAVTRRPQLQSQDEAYE